MIAIPMRNHRDTEFGLQTRSFAAFNIPDFTLYLKLYLSIIDDNRIERETRNGES
jgi:hypothetical protein